MAEPGANPEDKAPGFSSRASAPGRLSLDVLVSYSLPSVGFGFTGLLFVIYLMKFSTDVLLIAPGVIGTLFALSRLWDAISDPLVGYLSDRTHSRLGRRRSWMLAAALPVAVGIWMLWSPPPSLTGVGVVVWMAIALFVYETASTAFFIPYGALGVELTPLYHERTRLFGYRHVISALGLVMGLGAYSFIDQAGDPREAARLMASVGACLVAAFCLYSAWRLPERREYQGRGSSGILRSVSDVLRNPHARRLLIVYFIDSFGAASIGMLVPYVTEYVLNRPDLAAPIILIYFIPQFLFTPLWIRLSKKFGKKVLWLSSMWVSVFGFAALFFIDDGNNPLIWLVPPILGFAGGCAPIVAPSIKADIIDYDEYRTGERKEGAYLAAWNFIRKSAGAVTAFIVGWMLQELDFRPNMEQSEGTKVALRTLFSLIPAVCFAVGALIFSGFEFNEAEHRAVRRAIEEGGDRRE
ncbi:MAG: glycoside-pentoside-hexuronide (GPH):cation symporter [Myxococcota bacterium]|nr:glycoside-pentoside-hexuronide (GPH):cation symporter [Myxococcota bacterium]